MINWHLVWTGALASTPVVVVLLGVLGTIVWNPIDARGLRTEIGGLRTELGAFRAEFHAEVPQIRERLAKIEQRLDDAHIGTIIHTGR